jgi:hypothetical protein
MSDTNDNLNADLEVKETSAIEEIADKPVEDGRIGIKIDYPQLIDYFNVDSPTNAQREKMATIFDYFADESKTIGELLYNMRILESRLGSPALGESRLQKMYNYIRITSDIKDKEKQRDALMR